MGRQIIQQPHERYALWDSVVDDFVFQYATRQQVLNFVCEQAAKQAHDEAVRVMDALARGEKPYMQFTMTYEEACRWRDEVRKPLEDEEEHT